LSFADLLKVEKGQGLRQPESLIRRGKFAIRLHHAMNAFFVSS
jgi:hypothetical protein